MRKEYIVSVSDDDKDFDEMFVGGIKQNPELIRCEDCAHHHGYICDRLYGFQDAFSLQDDDYCSRAERRGEE